MIAIDYKQSEVISHGARWALPGGWVLVPSQGRCSELPWGAVFLALEGTWFHPFSQCTFTEQAFTLENLLWALPQGLGVAVSGETAHLLWQS